MRAFSLSQGVIFATFSIIDEIHIVTRFLDSYVSLIELATCNRLFFKGVPLFPISA